MTDRLDRTPSGSTEGQSLFSLVEAATIARPIPTTRESSGDGAFAPGSFNGPSSLITGGASSVGSSTKAHAAMKHRRLSSTGQARRRLSDAREATSRPSPVMLQTAAAALSSLATLSLSGSPPPQSAPQTATSFTSASGQLTSGSAAKAPKQESMDEDMIPDASNAPPTKAEINGAGISVTKTGKKRGTIFKCESCSKVYRHPSCLIKHRWEHSPHWREASKFLLSKHQQVQLLEAAAILSHLGPSATGGRSLPEDRSLWPSFLSGGLLPPPDTANGVQLESAKPAPKARSSSVSTSLDQPTVYPTSSSVPASSLLSTSVGTAGRVPTRSPSAGPRMHDYALPSSGGITHVRPGVVGVPMHAAAQPDAATVNANPTYASAQHRSAPMPVPVASRDAYREPRDGGAYSFVSASGASASEAWSSPVSVSFAQSSFRSSSVASHSVASYSAASGLECSFSFSSEGAGAWSLPRSSVRSSSLSRSRSGSVDEGDYVDVDSVGVNEDGENLGVGAGAGAGLGRFGFTSRGWKMDMARNGNGKIDEEEWDGMEMEMEM
ncbi:hypothetical protein C8Q79DRAFT_961813 [Trametes meyenii]|nr:hypothetical protein C8Q79DRAFT_961813 [Trametes meyenii]